ncbi:hypothetical protein [Aquimarina algiphila]|uniref:hypothetical protein n=1 Tax=Aquimarina algiphila TaxID=2047982 RepID=UPI00233078CC|nr:hypothetical protein [Aquimarina algiphila]
MKRAIVILLTLVFYSCMDTKAKENSGMNVKSPTQLTEEFIVDYKEWNDLAYILSNSDDESADEKIEKAYHDLILKYCSPDKKYQGIVYGSEADHCDEQEKITEEIIDDEVAIVKTTFKDREFDFMEYNYEYRYIKTDSKWILDEVYLVDEDGKYEGL